VRQTVAGYRSTGFEAELAHSKAALSAADITMRSTTAEADIGSGEGHLMAQILREATTNIIRHSGAGECSVVLERTAGGLRLTVEDNGRGAGDSQEGHGIQGMRRRLEAVGGRLRVENDNGVRLVAEFDDQNDEPPSTVVFQATGAKAHP
jgi:two-component system sensor histidine kinase DesK